MERIFNRNTKKTIIVPLDHGVTVGPIFGIVDLRETVNKVAEGGANAVLMHKGLPRRTHRGHGRDIGLIIHLSASTDLSPFPNAKTLVGDVEDAIRLGADAVSVHVNLGDETERNMLSGLGKISTRANNWGMPFLAMVYARGPKIENEFDPEIVKHCARLGEELGADVVKVPYTGDIESFSKVVESCWIPVVIAGGPKMDSRRDGEHDLVMLGWTGDYGDPDNFFGALLSCAAAPSSTSRWCYEPFDSRIVKATEIADQAEHTKLYEEAQVIFKEEVPAYTVAHSLVSEIMAANVTGYKMSPFGAHNFKNVDITE